MKTEKLVDKNKFPEVYEMVQILNGKDNKLDDYLEKKENEFFSNIIIKRLIKHGFEPIVSGRTKFIVANKHKKKAMEIVKQAHKDLAEEKIDIDTWEMKNEKIGKNRRRKNKINLKNK